ncbi:hypothetical protein Cni_G08773 [Canna indica]|uniref:Uncharacterized protein n=1 Tax=Canna indica TaxID=4628 RepID=A0AAQ3Q905_9LILI|nr:hypothetical protein Cni_G08773 [Canna indica]
MTNTMTGSQKINETFVAPSRLSHKNIQNPFKEKSKMHNVFSSNDFMQVDAFKSSKQSSVPVKVNLEKNVKDLHRKLTDTFSIAVNKIQLMENNQMETEDTDSYILSQDKENKIRKSVSQVAQVNSFLFNLKQNRAQKKR